MVALERFSSLGVFSIIFLAVAAVIHSITQGDVIGKNDDTQQTQPPTDISSMLWPSSFWDVMEAFPIIIFAFSCQVNVCAIFEELRPPTTDAINAMINETPEASKQRVMARITRNGILLCTTLYICIGLFGYLDFGNAIKDNILNSYCIQKSHDPLMIAASAFVAVAVVVAFPFNILPARVTLKLILSRLRKRRCGTFIEEGSANVSPSVTQSNDDNQIEPLLDDDRFGDAPHILPHMSLEGLAADEEEDLQSVDLQSVLRLLNIFY